jgi:phospholipase C
VVGDLTSAFDLPTPNTSWKVNLPDTDDFEPTNLVRFPDQVPVPPADQRLPGQERGVRPARALPYSLHADGRATAASVRVDLRNSGGAAAVFQVRSNAHDPRGYTVESARQLTDTWDFVSGYDLSVHGPNGFFRRFRDGGGQRTSLAVQARYDERTSGVILELHNNGTEPVEVTVSRS